MRDQAIRTATATAITRCRILVIEKKEMTRALHNGRPNLCSCEERLARALLLIARYDKIRKPIAVIPKIIQGTLGGLIGSTRSRVCYFMNKFKKLGYIEYGRDCEFTIPSLSGVLKDSIFSELHAPRPN